MLDFLITLSETLNLTFLYGEQQAFNKAVDGVTVYPILYHEGYVGGDSTIDSQGDIDDAYRLSLWLFSSISGADARPAEHKTTYAALTAFRRLILRKLESEYTLSGITFAEGVSANITDRYMDGVRLQLTAKPKFIDDDLCE